VNENLPARPPLRIVYLGPQAHGTNSGALAKALRRRGHLVQPVDPDLFLPKWGRGPLARFIGRMTRGFASRELNKRILQECDALRPDIFFVFKGPALLPETLEKVKHSSGACAVLFFPDVSVYAHGDLIPKCLPHYDHIFTTKTFGVADLRKIGITQSEFLPHAFDPDVHRELSDIAAASISLRCDASFIGTWSPKKEAILAQLKRLLPDINLKIWGNQWEKIADKGLEPIIVGTGIDGEAYALAIQSSTINIAILSEARQGASSGDQITSRTFHIPASGGFMLHERTDELQQYFTEDAEVACFATPEELAEKIRFYLEHPQKRELIRREGHLRCVAEDSMDRRATLIEARLYEQRERCRSRQS
jgi:spore maturation protein CgeB